MAKQKLRRPTGLPRTPRRLRLLVEDESRLARIYSSRLTVVRVAAVMLVPLLLGVAAGAALVAFSPLRRSLPGYLDGAERIRLQARIQHLDSLRAEMQMGQAFLDNIETILDTDRTPADSAAASRRPVKALPLDSLIGSSQRERHFVAAMEENEKYNLRVLSPLAAETMIWAEPAPGGVVVEQTRRLPTLRIIVPRTGTIQAMADGCVVSRVYDTASRTYSLILQHPAGFLSRYSALSAPLVEEGDRVLAGQVLGGVAQGSARTLGIEMWREGTPLLPAEYVGRPAPVPIEERQTLEAPRGKL